MRSGTYSWHHLPVIAARALENITDAGGRRDQAGSQARPRHTLGGDRAEGRRTIRRSSAPLEWVGRSEGMYAYKSGISLVV